MILTKENKKNIWDILQKYDGVDGKEILCDSLSNILKGTYKDDDILNIFTEMSNIDKEDLTELESSLGKEMNLVLF